jgi:transcriptional regulator with XRE-family HTH domain
MAERNDQQNELGAFLRARRERLTPADVGLPSNGRRRTPGLRREEVATLAGVSIDYLVRLEQGRDTHPSAAVVAALATALRLDDEERMHLAKMATIERNRELCPKPVEPTGEVTRTIRTLLERLQPTPAFVVDGIDNVLGWNDAWADLVRPMGLLDDTPPNLVRYVFLNPSALSTFVDWARAADEQAGLLRTAQLHHTSGLDELLDELLQVPEFARRWATHPVADKRRTTKRLRHPQFGELQLDLEVLLVADSDQQLVTWLPHDEHTAEAMRDATESTRPVSPAKLRVVGSDTVSG